MLLGYMKGLGPNLEFLGPERNCSDEVVRHVRLCHEADMLG